MTVQKNTENTSNASFDSIKKLFSKYITHTDRTNHQQRVFEVAIREVTIPIIKAVLTSLTLLVLLTWPTDFLLFNTEIIYWATVWRTGALVFSITVGLGLHYSEEVRKNVNPTFITSASCMLVVAGISMGNAAQLSRMSGILTPWFDISYLVPLLTTILSMKLVYRLVSTSVLTVSYVIGYLMTFPLSAWKNPYLVSSGITSVTSILMCTLLGHIIYHLNRRDFFRERELEEERQKIAELASTDQLTGLYNFRTFHDEFEREFERAKRYDEPLTLMMMDLDYFKDINDKYGHLAGDAVLETLGNIISDEVRQCDIAGRYGGEEFSILLPETELSKANTVAKRLSTRLKNQTFGSNGQNFSVTCSIGITQLNDAIDTPSDLLKQADKTLYRAKDEGRDRICTSN